MESVGQDHEVGGAGSGAVGARGRLVALVTLLLVTLAVPLVASGHADAVPSVPRVMSSACDGGTYTVVAGDGWYRIAGKVGVPIASLLAANHATTATWLFVGDVLCVPGGAKPSTTATSVPSARPTTTTARPTTTAVPTTAAPTTTGPFTGSVMLRQFPVQGICWFTDTWGASRSGGRHHEGVDVLASVGKKVYAVDDGTLTKQYLDRPGSLAGNGWRLTRADGTYYFYAHLDSFASGLAVGSKVKAGQIIGTVGQTGNAGAPHLHFEVHPGGGVAVNPTELVSAVNGCGTTKVPAQPGATPVTTTTTKPVTTTTKPVTTTTKPATTTTKPVTTTTKPVTATTKPATTTTAKPATTTTLPAAPATRSDARWQFISPVMALDTTVDARSLVAGSPTRVDLTGLAGIAPGTRGVLVRVVARRVSTAGSLSVHACGATTGGTASLSFRPGALAATVATAPVSGGAFCVTADATVDVRIAVIAQQSVGGVGMEPIGARRVLDTRRTGVLAAGTTQAITPAALGADPSAKAVTVTVTLLGPSTSGGFGIGACGGTPWIVAVDPAASHTFSAVVRTNSAGVCLSSTMDVQAVIDVTGEWSGRTTLAATNPSRLFDSRTGGVVAAGATTTATVRVPAGVTRAQLQVTLLSSGSSVSLTVWNCADRRPSGAVAYVPAKARTTVTVGMNVTGGSLCLAASSSARVLIDLVAVG